MSYTFMDTSPTLITLLTNELRTLLLEQEPRISNLDVQIDPNVREGCLIFQLSYTISDSNTRDNLVFPFYLNPGEEENDAGVQ